MRKPEYAQAYIDRVMREQQRTSPIARALREQRWLERAAEARRIRLARSAG